MPHNNKLLWLTCLEATRIIQCFNFHLNFPASKPDISNFLKIIL